MNATDPLGTGLQSPEGHSAVVPAGRSPIRLLPTLPVSPSPPSASCPGALARTVFSFEAAFALFLYSNNLKYFLPKFPIDETIVFFLFSAAIATFHFPSLRIPRLALPLLVTALLFFGWLSLSTLWTPGRSLALRSLSYNLVFNLYCLFVAAIVIGPDRERLSRFLTWILAIGAFLAIHGLWIYYQYGTFRFYYGFRGISAYLLWGFPVATASAVSLGFAFAAPLGTRQQTVGIALSLLFASFLLVCSARGAMLMYVVCLLVPVLLVVPRIGPNRLLISRIQLVASCGVACGLAYVAYVLYTGDVPYTIQRFFDLLGYIEGGGAAVRFERLNYWLQALEFWSRAPVVGNGVASFAALYLRGMEIPGTQPHNIILEILVDLGLVGLFLFCLLLWNALRRVRYRALMNEPVMLSVFLMFVAHFAVRAMTSDELARQWELFVALGLLAGSSATAERPSSAAPRPGV